MTTVLVTTYAVNPSKGSEDGMSWNFILQIARFQRVIAVTRPSNQAAIDQYWAQHPELNDLRQRIQFLYFDWPTWLRSWEKKPLLSIIYYYGWQLTLAIWLRQKKLAVDLVHTVNFQNDWSPTFLWLLDKPLVWGPVGHHPTIPPDALRDYGWRAQVQDRLFSSLKRLFWKLDPFRQLNKQQAAHILCMNQAVANALNLPRPQYTIMPSVASEPVNCSPAGATSDCFRVLSVGEFVTQKGFTTTIRAFAIFYQLLSPAEQLRVRLTLVGHGPQESLIRQLVAVEGIAHCTDIINELSKAATAECYRSASVFLFPSHECTSTVVAEAMSYGLPIICWDNDGPGQFVHPDSALRVSAQTMDIGIAHMALRLNDLFCSPETYCRESQLAKERFETAFSWSVRGEQLRRIYDTVLSKSPSFAN